MTVKVNGSNTLLSCGYGGGGSSFSLGFRGWRGNEEVWGFTKFQAKGKETEDVMRECRAFCFEDRQTLGLFQNQREVQICKQMQKRGENWQMKWARNR